MKSSRLRKFLVLAYSSLFACFLLEIGLRLVLPGPKFDTRLPLYAHIRENRDSIDLHGVSPVSARSTNEWGFRGDEPPENWDEYYTIVTVGGSTTQAFYLDDNLTWAALLQDHLQETHQAVWVGNAGLDGHTSRGHILLMEQVIAEIRPDAVILLVGVNDLGLSLTEGRHPDGNTYDRIERPLPEYWVSQTRLFQLLNRAFHIYIGDALTVESGHQTYVPESFDPSTETPLPDNLSEALPQLPTYRANLEYIINIAHSIDADVLLLTQPSLFGDSASWENVRGTTYFIQNQQYNLSARSWWRLLDEYNRATLDVCEQQNVACYDLALHIPHTMEYFYDPAHFTEAGAALVAEHVVRGVRQELWGADAPPSENSVSE